MTQLISELGHLADPLTWLGPDQLRAQVKSRREDFLQAFAIRVLANLGQGITEPSLCVCVVSIPAPSTRYFTAVLAAAFWARLSLLLLTHCSTDFGLCRRLCTPSSAAATFCASRCRIEWSEIAMNGMEPRLC